MSVAGTVGLGAVAGFTIFLGLPVARLRRHSTRHVAFLTAVSIGILLFLLYDIIAKANETVEGRLRADHLAGSLYGLLLAAGLAVGLLGLVVFERLVMRRRRPSPPSGPGALAAGGLPRVVGGLRIAALSQGQRVALFIAIGIGLHNFSEGLAIGQSAAVGASELFGVLVIGFALHNMTEGLGITAPLIGERPSWGFLGALGLIGGGPTFVGTLIGRELTSAPLSVLFLALAAGAIIYVVGELQHAGRKLGAHDLAMVGLLLGFLAGYGTDKLLVVAGS